MKRRRSGWLAACLTGALLLALASCGRSQETKNLFSAKEDSSRVIDLFSPME